MEFYWNHLKKNIQNETNILAYLFEIGDTAERIIESVTPFNFIDCIAILHSLDQKTSLVDFYIHHAESSLESKQWLKIIDTDYTRSYKDMLELSQDKITKYSLIYKIYPTNHSVVCLWNFDIINHISLESKQSYEQIEERYHSVDSYCQELQDKTFNIIRNISSTNFCDSYLELKQIDAKLIYIFSIISFYDFLSPDHILEYVEEEYAYIFDEMAKFYWNEENKKLSLPYMLKID
ncbi:hypothetical protein IGI39_004458 [Enterococcus sp. AZ135]|uniref:DUF7006 family protein n=1 Tax=unclassified Enterococcus TaxID=2608891 RepID=UPI003F265EE7